VVTPSTADYETVFEVPEPCQNVRATANARLRAESAVLLARSAALRNDSAALRRSLTSLAVQLGHVGADLAEVERRMRSAAAGVGDGYRR
jgi:hypothetical protein